MEKSERESPRTSPWVIEWHDRRLTVLLARGAEDARSIANERRGCAEDGWRDRETAEVRRVCPVASLELNVAPRAERNRPKAGFLCVNGQTLAWDGPHDGLSLLDTGDEGYVLDESTGDGQVEPTSLWSYVWSHRELVLLTDPSFKGACLRAARSCPASTRGAIRDLIEPIARFELQLAKSRKGHAPTCYRLWIDGVRVGWPPPEGREPHKGPPESPLPAEARLPIPAYAHTYAYGPGPRRKMQRRFDVPWPGDPTS